MKRLPKPATEEKALRLTQYNLLLTFIAVLVAGVSAYFVWESLQASNKNFANDKRPWIGLDVPSDDAALKRIVVFQPGRVEWSFPWKNFGNSPALHARQDTRFAMAPVSNLESPEFWKSMAVNFSTMDLDENEGHPFFPQQLIAGVGDKALPDDSQAQAWASGGEMVIIFGKSVYYDAYSPDRHETDSCIVVRMSAELGMLLRVCPMSLPAN